MMTTPEDGMGIPERDDEPETREWIEGLLGGASPEAESLIAYITGLELEVEHLRAATHRGVRNA